MMKELDRSARKVVVAAAVFSLIVVAPPAGAQEAVSLGCIVRSIDLEPQGEATLVRILTEGNPTSLGARLEAGGGVVLDLSGCAPAPELSGRSFAEGLVSALELMYDSEAPGLDTAVVVRTRGPFEYSVSSSQGAVSVVLRSKGAAAPKSEPEGAPEGTPEGQLVRVFEPLPLPVAPQPPLPDPTPEPAAPEMAAPPAPEPTMPRPEVITPSLQPPPPADTTAIAGTVLSWARAWSEKRADDYLAAYAAGFQPPQGLSRTDWEAQRRQRLAAPRFIEIAVDALQVRVISADRAIASFQQSYLSDSFSDQVYKSLTLTLEDGHWRILLEAVGPAGTAATAAQPTTPAAQPTYAALVEGARLSILAAPRYDSSYRVISYPGGDPGPDLGSAVDLVVRAYRHLGIDLQQRIHDDILAAGLDYGIWESDTNIDHRRIRNQEIFLRRHGQQLPLGPDAGWQPGDIVFWAVDGRRQADHVGILSEVRSPVSRSMVIHHPDGGLPCEQDVLFAWTVRGHYRWMPAV